MRLTEGPCYECGEITQETHAEVFMHAACKPAVSIPCIHCGKLTACSVCAECEYRAHVTAFGAFSPGSDERYDAARREIRGY